MGALFYFLSLYSNMIRAIIPTTRLTKAFADGIPKYASSIAAETIKIFTPIF